MKCSKCGFENRPDARFCKQCGQTLRVPAPATPPGAVCPACGATAKPGARFCPRCGKPLPAAPTPPLGQPSPPATQPAMPVEPLPSTTPSLPVPPAQPPTYAQPPAVPPPPAAPSAPRRRPAPWVWWGGCAVVILCIVLAVAAVFVVPRIIGDREEPSATPVPTTEIPTDTPTGAPTAAPTETPTEAPTAASTEALTPSAFDAQVGISASATELQVGDLLTITVTLTNTGAAPIGMPRFQLLGEWTPYLGLLMDSVVHHELDVTPGASDTATFVLEAVEPGTVILRANVTMEAHEPPRWESRSSDEISISITQAP